MMTTETPRPRGPGVGAASLVPGVLGGVLLITSAVGAAVVALAGLLEGRDGALGALVGSGVVVAVFAFGCGSLAMVARVLPSATLLVALVTYLAQAVVMVLLFVRLSDVPLFDGGPGRLWLALGLLAATMTWMTAHLVLTVRERVPYYDLTGGER